MKTKKQKLLLLAVVIFLVIALPIGIYLTRTQQLFRPRATFGQVTLHLVPLEVTKNIGEPFTVEVHANSADKQVSAIKVTLAGERDELIMTDVVPTDTTQGGSIELIYDKQIDPFSFTVLYKKPTSALPTGSFKVASVTLVPFEGGTATLGVDTTKSEAVGYNGTSEDVGLSIAAGTTVSYTINGSLCRVQQCIATGNITLNPSLRPDNKFNVLLTFTKATGSANLYKFYRNAGAAVPQDHPATHLAGIASPSASSTTHDTFVDTNDGDGFPGETNLHYDIDSYVFCSAPIPTTTPTSAVLPTTTPTITITPSPTPSG